MPRPLICRRVSGCPRSEYFKPAGIPLSGLEEVRLTRDELEALRLADLEGLYQAEAAAKMGVSRQTFGNIVGSARHKVADVLVNGRALRIQGGVIQMMGRTFTCTSCQQQWKVAFGTGRPQSCPQCGKADIHRVPAERGCGRRTDRGGFHGAVRP
jgi:predicted DNA-binding protein (UPF0251 family)